MPFNGRALEEGLSSELNQRLVHVVNLSSRLWTFERRETGASDFFEERAAPMEVVHRADDLLAVPLARDVFDGRVELKSQSGATVGGIDPKNFDHEVAQVAVAIRSGDRLAL